MSGEKYIGDARSDGTIVGRSATDKVGFYGAAPVVQPAVTHIGTTVISQVATSGKWAFSTSTAALAFISKVQSL